MTSVASPSECSAIQDLIDCLNNRSESKYQYVTKTTSNTADGNMYKNSSSECYGGSSWSMDALGPEDQKWYNPSQNPWKNPYENPWEEENHPYLPEEQKYPYVKIVYPEKTQDEKDKEIEILKENLIDTKKLIAEQESKIILFQKKLSSAEKQIKRLKGKIEKLKIKLKRAISRRFDYMEI